MQLPVVTLAPPAWLARLPLFKPLLILPDEQAAHWLRQGHLEFCLLLADPAQPDSVSAFADAVRTLLLVERRDTAQLQGPEVLLAEIAALETTRRRTRPPPASSIDKLDTSSPFSAASARPPCSSSCATPPKP